MLICMMQATQAARVQDSSDSGYLPAVLFPDRKTKLAALATLPPSAQEQMALDEFEAAILRDGEAQARLQNLLETVVHNARKVPSK